MFHENLNNFATDLKKIKYETFLHKNFSSYASINAFFGKCAGCN